MKFSGMCLQEVGNLVRTGFIWLLIVCAGAGVASAQPNFLPGEDPRPTGRVWKQVPHLSDEFDGSALDRSKWQDEPVGNGWNGYGTDKTEPWARKWDRIFHSNLIRHASRSTPEKVQLQKSVPTETKNWECYYVYGAWWKSPGEVSFHLNGKYVYSINFTRAYTAAPVCSPSRTAFFSGVAPWKSGHCHNMPGAETSESLHNALSLAGLFKKAGYTTAGLGKITHGWDQKEHWDVKVIAQVHG